MLSARRRTDVRGTYDVSLDGQPVTTVETSAWRAGLRFPLAGVDHELRAKLLSSRFEIYAGGAAVAVAGDVGRARWTLDVEGRRHDFRRTSFWREEHALLEEGRPAGMVGRDAGGTGFDADLPTLPVHVQVFALAVVLTLSRSTGGGD